MKLILKILLVATFGVTAFSLFAWRNPETVTEMFGPLTTLFGFGFIILFLPVVFLLFWWLGGRYLSTRWEKNSSNGNDT